MSNLYNRYCSWCYEKTDHILHEWNLLRRNVYFCNDCENYTLECRACQNMAKGDMGQKRIDQLIKELGKKEYEKLHDSFFSWDEEFCAEHDGTIGSFARLKYKVNDITDFKIIFKKESIDFYKIGKYATGSLAATGVVAASIVTLGGAPAIASALGSLGLLGAAGTGTAISSLSGAALTSASLAAIGGSMATGTIIITACGSALGGVLGGVIGNKYYSEDDSFNIISLQNSDEQSHVVFINGFLQEEDTDFQDWKSELKKLDCDQNVYGMTWSSKTNLELGKMVTTPGLWGGLQSLAIEAAKKGGMKVAANLGGIGLAANISNTLFGNPWHISMYRAGNAGALLADIISRTENQKFTLVGHSLGARVIYYALEALSSKHNRQYIDNVILLGGAVGNDSSDWKKVLGAISGNIYNCYSKNDSVLEYLYQPFSAYVSKPVGLHPIKGAHDKIQNIDCSQYVHSHMDWKDNYSKIYRKIFN